MQKILSWSWARNQVGIPICMKKHFAGISALALMTLQVWGQSFSVLHNFTNTPDGKFPEAGLLLSSNKLYGTTYLGGAYSNGVVFSMNTDGTEFTVMHDFSPLVLGTNFDGANPQSSLTLINDTLYGTARSGGFVVGISVTTGQGTVFSINTNGTNFAIVSYIPQNQIYPQAGLAFDGTALYGTTFGTGSQNGTVFSVGTNGDGFATLTNGGKPSAALLIDGNALFGTYTSGTVNESGTVFRMNKDGSGLTNLVVFERGGVSYARLILSGQTLYGTTASGGTSGEGSIFKINEDGTGYTILKSFPNGAVDKVTGGVPAAGLVLSGSTLYGTTKYVGTIQSGALFRINIDGSGYSVLKYFGGSSGSVPLGDLLLNGNTLYGTTQLGGSAGYGVVFSLVLPPPSLQVTAGTNGPIVFWVDDGQAHTLESTTDLTSGNWVPVPGLNWTNSASGAMEIGYQTSGSSSNLNCFFKLQ